MKIISNIAITLILITFNTTAFALTAPYDWEYSGSYIYRSVLNKAKITHPGSNKIWEKEEFRGQYDENFFYIPANGDRWMTLRINGDKGERTELRRLGEFSKTSGNEMGGVLKLTRVPSGEVTVLQVHNVDKSIGAPPLRIARRNSDFYAIFRTDDCPKGCSVKYDKIKLCSIRGAKNFRIKLINGNIEVDFDGKHEIFSLHNWPSSGYYFKAGAYLQSDGNAETKFQWMHW